MHVLIVGTFQQLAQSGDEVSVGVYVCARVLMVSVPFNKLFSLWMRSLNGGTSPEARKSAETFTYLHGEVEGERLGLGLGDSGDEGKGKGRVTVRVRVRVWW